MCGIGAGGSSRSTIGKAFSVCDHDIETMKAVLPRCEIASVYTGLMRYWRRAPQPVLRRTQKVKTILE